MTIWQYSWGKVYMLATPNWMKCSSCHGQQIIKYAKMQTMFAEDLSYRKIWRGQCIEWFKRLSKFCRNHFVVKLGHSSQWQKLYLVQFGMANMSTFPQLCKQIKYPKLYFYFHRWTGVAHLAQVMDREIKLSLKIPETKMAVLSLSDRYD